MIGDGEKLFGDERQRIQVVIVVAVAAVIVVVDDESEDRFPTLIW